MRRRAALTVASCAILGAGTGNGAPTEEERLNRFARAWNRYVEQLKIGIIDLKLWAAVAREWEKLK